MATVAEMQPCGGLLDILNTFQAPPEIAKKVARRVGAIVGPSGISHNFIEETILDSMTNGLPNWERIFETLGEAGNRVYKGKKI